MRLAHALTLTAEVAAAQPSCRVRRIYNGPAGYSLQVIEPGGRFMEYRSRADWKRMQPKEKAMTKRAGS